MQKSYATIIHGMNSITNFIPQTGTPKSKKLSTVMKMPLNILDAMPIALLSRIQELFPLTRKKFLFMLKIIEPTSKRLLLFPVWNLSADSWCMFYLVVFKRFVTTDFWIIVGNPKIFQSFFGFREHRHFISKLSNLSMDEILLKVWNYNIRCYPSCGCCSSMRPSGITYVMRN